jgi:hypothetical protein
MILSAKQVFLVFFIVACTFGCAEDGNINVPLLTTEEEAKYKELRLLVQDTLK